MRVALVCALVGCAYQPGSFVHAQHDFVGQRITIGCLDVAVERRVDASTGPVLGYRFGNRCDHPALIDFDAVAVIGRNPQGADVALRPYDPRHEIRLASLDGRGVGAEAIAYAADRPLLEVCADAAALVHEAPPRWLCFTAPALATGGPR